MPSVSIGKKIPAFSAAATGGTTVTPKGLAGQPYVLYFYPKDSTPGCTTEGQDFRNRYAAFSKHKVRIFGVSRDTLASHDRFKNAHEFPFELISDPDETLCRLFDVIGEKKMFGKTVLGVQRSTFLVDSAGVLRQEWRKVKVADHVSNVLKAAVSL